MKKRGLRRTADAHQQRRRGSKVGECRFSPRRGGSTEAEGPTKAKRRVGAGNSVLKVGGGVRKKSANQNAVGEGRHNKKRPLSLGGGRCRAIPGRCKEIWDAVVRGGTLGPQEEDSAMISTGSKSQQHIRSRRKGSPVIVSGSLYFGGGRRTLGEPPI